MPFPNRLKAVLLFDTRIQALDAIVRGFARIEEMKTGTIFNVPDHQPDTFAQLENSEEGLALTFEYSGQPPVHSQFADALASHATTRLCGDMPKRIKRSGSHIVLEVWHEGEGPDAKASVHEEWEPEKYGLAQAEAGQQLFHRRLEILALMGRIVLDHAEPSAVYWAQSDQLFSSKAFDTAASGPIPGPLHIQPILFGPKRQALDPEPEMIGLRTKGAHLWTGAEFVIEPCAQDWRSSYTAALGLVGAKAGVHARQIGDGEKFTPQDGHQSYRLDLTDPGDVHAGLEPDGGAHSPATPLYKLVPLKPTKGITSETSSSSQNIAASFGQAGTQPALSPARKPVFGRKRS